jgi:hypothetical protein
LEALKMNKAMIKITSVAFTACMFATSAYAAPVTLNDDQMDSVAGGAFVCPVIKTDGVLNASNGAPDTTAIGDTGYYTVVTATGLKVPAGATNGDGDGFPSGDATTFSAPGDTDYTAIWNITGHSGVNNR